MRSVFNLYEKRWKLWILMHKLTCDKRQRRDSRWFLATESPINASFLPRRILRNALASNLASSQLSGFHLQFRKSESFLPCLKQFFDIGIVAQLEFVYCDPLNSGTQCPLNKSHFSWKFSTITKPNKPKTQKHVATLCCW